MAAAMLLFTATGDVPLRDRRMHGGRFMRTFFSFGILLLCEPTMFALWGFCGGGWDGRGGRGGSRAVCSLGGMFQWRLEST